MGATAIESSQKGPEAESLGVHLQMIQAVIGRMGQNAFNVKTWAITVMAAVFALGSAFTSAPRDVGVVVLALLLFWTMDAYFLRQEHLFRRLYDAAVLGEAPPYSMNTAAHAEAVGGLPGFLFSGAVWPIHAITVIAVGARAFKGL